jgi:methyl-accepting chemotaxis protein
MNNARIIRTIIINPDEKARTSNKAEYDKNTETNDENFKKLEKIITSDREKSALKAIYENRDAFLAYSGEVLNLAMAKKEAEASKVLFGEKYKVQAAYFASLDKLIEHEENDMVEYGKQSDEGYTSTRNIVIAISIASLAIGIFISIRIVNSLINQLGGEPDYVSQIIRRIAAGDLTVSIASKQGDTHSMVASMKEIQRLSSGRAFVQVDSYHTPEQKTIFESWVLTAEFHDYPSGWIKVFEEAGYQGDYYWTIID